MEKPVINPLDLSSQKFASGTRQMSFDSRK